MSWDGVIFFLFSAILAFGLFFMMIRRRQDIESATLEYRIALDFIAEEGAVMPREFAACFRDGNVGAIERKFPEFFAFRRQRLAEETAWEDFA